MRKTILFLFFAAMNVSAQEMTYDDFKTLIPALQKQDYRQAFEKSGVLLNTKSADTSDLRAQVAYINIYASAGMVTEDLMSHSDFEKNLKKFVGKKLKMPGHPCVAESDKAYNSFQFQEKDGELQGYTMTANQSKTNILFFEYYKNFKETVNQEDFLGKNVRLTGILESYEINPNQSTIWIARLHISPCYIRVFIPK